MNLAQMRIAVRDILTAGGGTNMVIGNDDFWSDSEINLALNRAQDEIYKIIKNSKSDYFTRILRTTDGILTLLGQTFDTSSLRWVAGQGNYQMPIDFVRMKLITDLSSDRVRLSASDLAKSEFRILMNENASGTSREYLYDILSMRTLVVRPIPDMERDFEFIYEKRLQQMRDYTIGNVYALAGSNQAIFTSGATGNFSPGDEIMANTTRPDPNKQYSIIKSIDSPTQATLESVWVDPTYDVGGNGPAPTPYIVSSVSEIPRHHHQMLVCLAASYCFKKGTNPHMEAAAIWRSEYDSMVPLLINEVETRQGSDVETAQGYLEDTFD